MSALVTPGPLSDLGHGETVSVRDLLRRFGAARRGYRVVAQIRRELDATGLITEPDFDAVHIDALIKVTRAGQNEAPASAPDAAGTGSDLGLDPVQRIGRMVDTNRPLVSVRPGTSVLEASTKMMMRDFSQLPVLRTEYECMGLVSWRSIGTARALGADPSVVDDCLEPAEVVRSDEPLSHVIERFGLVDAILIRSGDRKVSGILTSSDVSVQFHDFGEPFLILGEIENHLRALVSECIELDELIGAQNPGGPPRDIRSAADLTFGEYRRLLERPNVWARVGLSVDRPTFVRELEAIRELRNDIMHFDPDGLAPDDFRRLREFSEFVRRVVARRRAVRLTHA